jgi:hypothetical protein
MSGLGKKAGHHHVRVCHWSGDRSIDCRVMTSHACNLYQTAGALRFMHSSSISSIVSMTRQITILQQS